MQKGKSSEWEIKFFFNLNIDIIVIVIFLPQKGKTNYFFREEYLFSRIRQNVDPQRDPLFAKGVCQIGKRR